MAEQLIRNEQVAGSIPVTSSNKRPSKLNGLLGFLSKQLLTDCTQEVYYEAKQVLTTF